MNRYILLVVPLVLAVSGTAYAPSAAVAARAGAAPAPQALDAVFADDFETGGLSRWTGAGAAPANAGVSRAAGIQGLYGLAVSYDTVDDWYAQGGSLANDTPDQEAHYRARVYYDPNSFQAPKGYAHVLLRGTADRTGEERYRVEVRRWDGGYQVRAVARRDDHISIYGDWHPILPASNALEIAWQAATGAGANDGYLWLWINGEVQLESDAELSSLDNDTQRIGRTWLGLSLAPAPGSWLRGTEYFDAFEVRRYSYMGPLPECVLSGTCLPIARLSQPQPR